MDGSINARIRRIIAEAETARPELKAAASYCERYLLEHDTTRQGKIMRKAQSESTDPTVITLYLLRSRNRLSKELAIERGKQIFGKS